ncbi:hypothetical protein K523DRAFT_232394 [Schizophyllum commune Tattone D]|nr:hypothetical protein K523DRAFT_232394 [Schizophyllum commune Tattone D]
MTTLGANQTAFIPYYPPQSVHNGSSQSQTLVPRQKPVANGTSAPVAGPSTAAAGTSTQAEGKKPPKIKKRTQQEEELMAQTAARFAERLAADQQATLKPDVDTPFVDAEDVVRRLLPYHIYQQPKEDLEKLISPKGKGKAEDDIRTEIEETKFALECHKRKRKLHDRLYNMRVREGRRQSPADQAFYLEQVVSDAERAEIAWLSSEVKSARSELDRLERVKRAKEQAARQSTGPTTTTFYVPPATASQTQYYQYPYTYAQGYGSGQPLTFQPYMPPQYATSSAPTTTSAAPSPAPTFTTAVPSPAPTQAAPGAYASYYQATANQGFPTMAQPQMQSSTPKPAPTPQPAASTSTASPAASSAPKLPPNGTFPLNIPVTYLPALKALSIVPVNASEVQPGAPQPAAVIKGTTPNGQIALDICIAALKPNQLGGLSLIINKMMPNKNAQTGASASNSGTPGAGPSGGEYLLVLCLRCVLQFHCTRPRSFDGRLGLLSFFILNVLFNIPPIWQHSRRGALGEAEASLLDFVGLDRTPSKARLLALDWFIQFIQLVCIVFAYQSSDSPSADILPVHNDPPPDAGKIYRTTAQATQDDGDLIMDITITDIIRLLRARVTTPLARDYTPPSRASLLPVRDPMTFLLRGRAGSPGEIMAASRLARGTTQRDNREDTDEGQDASTGRIPGGLD